MATRDVIVELDISSPGGLMRFAPFSVTASNGTSVVFQWTGVPGSNSSITQSSPTEPCTPIPGGFDSGFQVGTDNPFEFPERSFTVDDDRNPLFFFAQNNQTSDCSSGAFFVLNPAQNGTISSSLSSSQNPTGTSSPTASPTIPIPSSSVTRSGKHTNVPAIVGSIVGSLVVLFLCVTAILIRRRRILQHGIRHNASRSLGPHTESGLPESDGDHVNTRPEPLVLYEKDALATDSSLSVPSTTYSAALPTAAELALASMADDMRALRGQMQRLEQDRRVLGNAPVDDLPPEYATSI
ncbi:hypothetical protein C8R44DRAFT_782841 [Mycena epipterygia]|nr:hypothetical protein C8R44DRAFT_782841 [Mycena epipterygia]